jgi:ATP-dependent Clp protease ATP-binding subunit ClpC
VLVRAQEEARQLDHGLIGTEHILLGLIHEGEGVAAKALASLGITLESARGRVMEAVSTTGHTCSGAPPFTPRAKKALEHSLREALQLGHSYIGTEHLLLGIVREGDGVAAQVLVSLGADLGRVRQQVLQMMSGYQGTEDVSSRELGQVFSFSGRRPEDTLLLRLLWNSNMIREPQNEAEQSIWDELKERIEPSSGEES